ncbi:unannotated protein [freshwater metagenome]|uniref:Unannotated protein n=1 Tax=freshwater metagenome TaxID=449393 RepID=A0A6J6H6S4_9ZZZZ
MITDTLDNRCGAAVSNTEALSDDSAQEHFALRCTVENNIASNDVLFSRERCALRWPHNDAAAREALTRVIVGIALKAKRDSLWQERTETLTSRSFECDRDRVVGKPFAAKATRQFSTEHRAHSAVDIPDRRSDLDSFTTIKRGCCLANQLVVEGHVETMILCRDASATGTFGEFGQVEDRR